MELEQRVLRFTFKDAVYAVHPQDISAARLRQFKAWFGKEYGAYLPFLGMVGQLDGDAVACAMWTARTKAGVGCPEANQLDWTPEDLLPLYSDAELALAAASDDEPEPGPTEPEVPATATPDSTPTA